MAHVDPLLSQAWVQQVDCHYVQAQAEYTNSGRPPLPIFLFNKQN